MVFSAHPDVLTSVLLLLVLKPSPAYSLVSMLVYSTVSQVVPESGTETYINAVLCLSFMVGCLLTLLGSWVSSLLCFPKRLYVRDEFLHLLNPRLLPSLQHLPSTLVVVNWSTIWMRLSPRATFWVYSSNSFLQKMYLLTMILYSVRLPIIIIGNFFWVFQQPFCSISWRSSIKSTLRMSPYLMKYGSYGEDQDQ